MSSKRDKETHRIMIVDDETTVADSLKMVLEMRGFDTLAANDGRTGLRMIREHKPDLVVLDLVLPGLDGLSLLEEMKKDSECKSIPVIIVTVVTQGSELADGFWGTAVGVAAFITKPFDPFRVADRIESILGNRKKK